MTRIRWLGSPTCSAASPTPHRAGLPNCCHGIGNIRTCGWPLELWRIAEERDIRLGRILNWRSGAIRRHQVIMDGTVSHPPTIKSYRRLSPASGEHIIDCYAVIKASLGRVLNRPRRREDVPTRGVATVGN